MASNTWVSLALGCALALAGCGDRPRESRSAVPAAAVADRAHSPNRQSTRLTFERQLEAAAPARTAIRASLSREGPVQVLALSGGGQWGAFGAGFLKGWTRHESRPAEFQVVTGTSTGSLLATFAFLGRDFDDAVGRAYLDIRGDSDVMKQAVPADGGLFSDALATTGPLRRRLEAQITDDLLSRVAAEGAKGRKLFVGAVDLGLGRLPPVRPDRDRRARARGPQGLHRRAHGVDGHPGGVPAGRDRGPHLRGRRRPAQHLPRSSWWTSSRSCARRDSRAGSASARPRSTAWSTAR